jgi:hypothetical protein
MMKSRGFVRPSEELEGEITAKVRRRSADWQASRLRLAAL